MCLSKEKADEAESRGWSRGGVVLEWSIGQALSFLLHSSMFPPAYTESWNSLLSHDPASSKMFCCQSMSMASVDVYIWRETLVETP